MSALDATRAVKNDAAFAVRLGDRSVHVSQRRHRFEFTKRWFRLRNQSTYSTYLPPRFPPDEAWNALLIGVFEGADSVWLCQNVLRHPDSRLLGVDPWLATPKLDEQRMAETYDRARRNLRPYRGQVQLVRGLSQEILPQLAAAPASVRGRQIAPGEWDLIIVDGDHRADAVLADARNALRLIRPGQWILFDDVRNKVRKQDHVYQGLIRWLEEDDPPVELVWAHRHMNCYRRVPDVD